MPDETRKPGPKRPAGLKPAGRRLWKAVVEGFALRPDEVVLLESACKTVDLIADLEAGMAGQPLVTTGSAGQLREHPLISEARAQRHLLKGLLCSMKLPDDGAMPNQHRAAAYARWSPSNRSAERS